MFLTTKFNTCQKISFVVYPLSSFCKYKSHYKGKAQEHNHALYTSPETSEQIVGERERRGGGEDIIKEKQEE